MVKKNRSIGYIYLTTCKEKDKINTLKPKFSYVPLLNEEDIEIDGLIGKKMLFGLKKQPLSFYGYFEIKDIIKKEDDEKLYTRLLDKYNLTELNNLYFMEYEKINLFDYQITIKNINENSEKYKIQRLEIKRNKISYTIQEVDINEIINVIEKIIEEIASESEEEVEESGESETESAYAESDCSDKSDESDESDSSETESKSEERNKTKSTKKTEDYFVMQIPILWIPCISLVNSLDEYDIKKKNLISHYKKCKKCEIVDNNRLDLEFEKKLLFKETNDKKECNKIIKSYSKALNLIFKRRRIDKYEYDLNKINIIYYKEDESLYNKCIFIINYEE